MQELEPQEIIDQIRRQRTVTADGQTYPIRQHPIDAAEGRFLSEFISSRPEVVSVLEVGCAYGVSSLHIAGALSRRPGSEHLIIDPYQSTDWHGIGVTNLQRAAADFELREEPSEIVMPQLLGRNFDLVFIDGLHTFDQTFVDLYYANRLIKPGGYIVLDDANWASVAKAFTYFAAYPCYEVVGGASTFSNRVRSLGAKILKPLAETLFPRRLYDRYASAKYPTMVAFQKVAEDERDQAWFCSF